VRCKVKAVIEMDIDTVPCVARPKDQVEAESVQRVNRDLQMALVKDINLAKIFIIESEVKGGLS
jgi:hypothetical protein